MLIVCLTLWGTARLFPQWLHHLHSSQQCVECSSFSTSSPKCLVFFCCFLNISSGHELVELVSYCDWFGFFLATPHSIWDLSSPGMKPVPLALRAWNLNQSWTIGEFPYWGFDLHFPQCFDSLNMTQVFSLYPSLLAFATVPTFLCLPTGRGRRVRVN